RSISFQIPTPTHLITQYSGSATTTSLLTRLATRSKSNMTTTRSTKQLCRKRSYALKQRSSVLRPWPRHLSLPPKHRKRLVFSNRSEERRVGKDGVDRSVTNNSI